MIKKIFISAMLSALYMHANAAEKTVAIVKGKFDHVEILLNHYKIPYEIIPFGDLEKKESLKKYRSVFFPCGIGRSIESNITVSASGYYVQHVSLKDLQKKVETEKISENIRDFVRTGGSAYFSDFSYDLLQHAYSCFEFYFNFPNLGISGTYPARAYGGLKLFLSTETINCSMPHEGWVLIKSMKDSDTLAEARVDTPKGIVQAALLSMMHRGSGEILYSSYHSSNIHDEIMRYMIFRTTMKKLLAHHMQQINKWNQDKTSDIIDTILPGENVRSYTVILHKGKNTIYFYAEKGLFQVDLYTKKMELVLSKDTGANVFSIDVDAAYSGEYIISLYGSGDYAYAPLAVISAAGWRLIPYITAARLVLALLLIFIVSVIITAYRLSHPKEIGGRIRR